jgi:PAT family beta-lactamase induction signal transducer AmpG
LRWACTTAGRCRWRRTHQRDTNAAAIARTLWQVIVEFFKKPGIWVSIIFIILFRAGEAQVQSIGPLFLREARELGGLGLSTSEVGAVYGTVGTVAFVVGSIAGGYFTSWLSLKRAILWLILAVNLPNMAFYLLSVSSRPTCPSSARRSAWRCSATASASSA